ncbi:MAG: methyltransferase domain-containing protein [Actinobacteria bacterium]|nr:methyltransferase domain-containing protein [Actinomycetota bacterium]
MLDYDSPRYARINRWDPSHLDRIDRLLDLEPGDRVLEVGCGRGHLTRRLAGRGIDVTGIDVNPNAAELAGSDRVLTMRAQSLDFEGSSFDYLISIHALEHIAELGEALAEMARVLRPGGSALHIYPAEPIKGLYAIPTSIILHGTPFKATEVHCHRLWPAKLRRMMSPLGLTEASHEFNLFRSPQFVSVFEKTG